MLYNVQDKIATITLNRPRHLNAFNQRMRLDLHAAIQAAESDDAVRVVILTGAGKGLSAGTDLAEAASLDPSELDRVIGVEFQQSLLAIRHSTRPYICAFDGPAVGIATAYALICDLTIVTDRSYIQQPFADIGLVPDGGLTWHLVNLLGYKKAFEIFALPDRISAADCLILGMVNRVVHPDSLRDETQASAKKLVQKSALSLGLLKKALHLAHESSLEAAMSFETASQKQTASSAYFKAAAAAFLSRKA